jgi:hypothetical protein
MKLSAFTIISWLVTSRLGTEISLTF